MKFDLFRVKNLYESLGKEKFLKETLPLVEAGEILGEGTPDRDWGRLLEAVDSETFVSLIGSRIVLKVRDGYNFVKNPLEPIFKTEPSSLKKETVVGLKGPADLEKVREGENYPARGIGELKLEYDNEKYGELVEITWETIKFDRYNAVIKAAGEVGENAKLLEARLSATALLDSGDTGYDGSGVYVSGHGNVGTSVLSADSLADAITTMRRFKDEENREIIVIPKWLVVSEDLRITALKLLKSILEPGIAEHAYNVLKDEGLTPISVPFWSSTTAWILVGTKAGAQRGWIKNEVLPIEIYTRRGQQTDEGFRRDIESSWKVRLMCNFHNEDWRYGYRGNS